MRDRARLVAACRSSSKTRAAEWTRCKRDPVHFIEAWGWTYDPRLVEGGGKPRVPFALFPKQREFVGWLRARSESGESGAVKKSRDVGFTWLTVGFAVWGWLFVPGFSITLGSRKEALVDRKGDLDSILERARYFRDALPDWMIPPGFDRKIHDNHLLIVNPDTGASVSGEGGDNMGRGGRSSVYIADEFAFVARAEMVDAALSQNSNCIIYGSSANGIANLFYKKTRNKHLKQFTIRWQDDPRKDAAWYQRQIDNFDAHIVASEVDIDFAASVQGIAIPAKWVEACVGLELPAGPERHAGLDPAKGGADNSLYAFRNGPIVERLVSVDYDNTTQVAAWADLRAVEDGATDMAYDVIGIGAGVEGHLKREGRAYKHHAVNVALPGTMRSYPDGRRGKAKYANLRTEVWMNLRSRIERTFRHVTEGAVHDPADMISLPDDPVLVAELSTPLLDIDSQGRLALEGKKAMAKRLPGFKSPDRAEAVALAFAVPLVKAPDILIGFA